MSSSRGCIIHESQHVTFMPSLLLDLAIKNDGIVCVPNIVPKVADDALVTPVHVRVGQDGDFGIFPADGLLCLTLRCARLNV